MNHKRQFTYSDSVHHWQHTKQKHAGREKHKENCIQRDGQLGRIIKCISKKKDDMMWTGLKWLTIGHNGSVL
jgi:hypothetical protein